MNKNLNKFFKLNEELLKKAAEITELSATISREDDDPLTATLTTVWLRATLDHLITSIDSFIEQGKEESLQLDRLDSLINGLKQAQAEEEAQKAPIQ